MGHLQDNGFEVEVVDTDLLGPVRAEYGVTSQLSGCHTAVVDGYVVEGHVPADVIKRVLAERPDVQGVAVPGMPIGSPGMEGGTPQPYNVYAFQKDGRAEVYDRR